MTIPVFKQLAKCFIRFGLVGGSGVFVDMGVLFLLADRRMLSWDLSRSKCLAAKVAIVNNFIWNPRNQRSAVENMQVRCHNGNIITHL